MRRKKTPRWLEAARTAGKERGSGEAPDWLSRALSRAGVLPLAEAERAIVQGRVCVGGRVVKVPFAPVPKGAVVQLDGRTVSLNSATLVLAFHKPAGVVTAPVDPQGNRTVFDLLLEALPPELRGYGWHAVGRLDRDTTGLLLFTNDARFVAHATSPSTHLPKRYIAGVLGKPTEEKLESLRKGLVLDDGPTRPAKAVLKEPGVIELTITEGRNHQVKRMLGALGLPVHQLHREAIGELALDLPVGTCRLLTPEELHQHLRFSHSAQVHQTGEV